tara:strand:+ start:1811 stop:3166 length:1356 start_codon:yes stop_codon:yes gene_type:complete
MRRATLRSASSSRSGGCQLAIPSTLPANGTIAGSAKRFKREHEDGLYAKLRSSRGRASILVHELRDEWRQLLLPLRGSVHTEGTESMALAAGAEVPDVPPLYLGACVGNEAAQQLLEDELQKLISNENWSELWVLFGQISMCLEQLARADRVRPWWMRQAPPAGGLGDVADMTPVDLAAREEPGGADAPLDAEAAAQPAVKLGVDAAVAAKAKAAAVPKLEASDESSSDANRSAVPYSWLGDWVVYAQMFDAQREISQGPPFWATTVAMGWKAEGSTFKLSPDGSGELMTEEVGDGDFSVLALNGTIRFTEGGYEWKASETFRSQWSKWNDVWMPLEIEWLEADPPHPDQGGGSLRGEERPAEVLTPGLRLRARLPCIPAFLDRILEQDGIYRDDEQEPFTDDDDRIYSSFREYVEEGCPWLAELYLCRLPDYPAAKEANEPLRKGFLYEG